VGYRALESLRLEKGYRAWSSDITPNDTPFEAGLGWAVKMKTNRPFLGREALEAAAGKPLRKALRGVHADDPDAVLLGRETILRDGWAGGLPDLGRLWLHGRGDGTCWPRASATAMSANPKGVTEDPADRGRYDRAARRGSAPTCPSSGRRRRSPREPSRPPAAGPRPAPHMKRPVDALRPRHASIPSEMSSASTSG
jgi:hypothetical protein